MSRGDAPLDVIVMVVVFVEPPPPPPPPPVEGPVELPPQADARHAAISAVAAKYVLVMTLSLRRTSSRC
jgi:hypothetical protein